MFSCIVLYLGLSTLLFSKHTKFVTTPEWNEQKLWGAYWTVEPGFSSTLEMKNNRVHDTLTARVSLYSASGEEYYLHAITMAPRETVVVSINNVMESLPPAIAARAGKNGTIELEFDGPNSSAIMGSVTVRNPEKKIAWNFFLYPSRPGLAYAPLQGVFWFPDHRTDGFVVIQNVSESMVRVYPTFEIASARYPAASASLLPGQLYKFDLRKELRSLGLQGLTMGGIEVNYEGASDAIRAHGVLYNGAGFSAEIDFLRRDAWDAQQSFYLRTPRFAVGSADPVLGLPTRTKFDPYVVLHNFGSYLLQLTLKVGVTVESATKEIDIPIAISAGTTKQLSLGSYLAGTVGVGTHWANLEVSYAGTHNNLAGLMVSLSHDGAHSVRSVLNWVGAPNREGWHWRIGNGFNTLVSIQNSDTEPAEVAFSLDYQDQGIPQSYELPVITIPGRGTHHVNIGEVIAAGVPDAEGDVIPPSVSFGGYRARKLGGVNTNITTEALIVDGVRSNFLSVYNTGCCDGPMFLDPSSITSFAGTMTKLRVLALNSCTGEEIDYTDQAFKRSSDNSVATVDLSGVVELVGAGSTKIKASLAHLVADLFGSCSRLGETRECAVTSKPRIDSISPGRGLIGASTMVTIQGRGFVDGSTTVSAGPGIAVTLNSVSQTQIVATFDVSTSAPAGNHSVTATVTSQTSNSVNFFVQVPSSLSGPEMGAKIVYHGDELRDCFNQLVAPVFFGYSRCADYTVLDQAGISIRAEMEVREEVVVQDTNVSVTSHIGEGATDSTGLFKDFLAFGSSTAAPSASAFVISRQTLSVLIGSQSFILRVNCQDFRAEDVTVTNRTAAGVNVDCTSN